MKFELVCKDLFKPVNGRLYRMMPIGDLTPTPRVPIITCGLIAVSVHVFLWDQQKIRILNKTLALAGDLV